MSQQQRPIAPPYHHVARANRQTRPTCARPCEMKCEWDNRVLNTAGANPQADWFQVPDVMFWRKRSNEMYALAVAPSLPIPRQVGKVWRTLLFSH